MIHFDDGAPQRRRDSIRQRVRPFPAGSAAHIALPHAFAQPLRIAANEPRPEHTVRALLRRCRFDSVSYFITRRGNGAVGGELCWSTLPDHWVERYRRANFVAVDPRLARGRAQIAPWLWDAGGLAAGGSLQRFLAEAAAVGVRSGVVVSLTDGELNQVTVTFDSATSPVGAARREAIAARLGDLVLFAIALHEFVLEWRATGAAGRPPAAPVLTLRERDCLELAARGMTSADIGTKLCVAERTVNFHFSNIKMKLGAMNRPEAIARGIALGLVSCPGNAP
ncbi:MAG: autoinducer binding domain-containing protein [Betaproteobacteria bacterium]|nr:autoinducer binding domain-containing protein [Betaproteobacteria bacterium]MCC6380010.1 autoinducer binding domain-containing protein [Burkholderiales bacterium]